MVHYDDLDRIMAVMAVAFDPQYGEAWTRPQVDNILLLPGTHYTLIAPDGAAPAEGAPAAGFSLVRAVAGEVELLLFAVAPEWRRRGLGAALLRETITWAQQRGDERMFLEMRDGNPAEALYRAHRFVPIGRRPKYYRCMNGERIDAITFACDLD